MLSYLALLQPYALILVVQLELFQLPFIIDDSSSILDDSDEDEHWVPNSGDSEESEESEESDDADAGQGLSFCAIFQRSFSS